MTEPARTLQDRLREHLALIYPDLDNEALAARLLEAMPLLNDSSTPPRHRNLWDEKLAILITYGDSIVREGEAPLRALVGSIAKCRNMGPKKPKSARLGRVPSR